MTLSAETQITDLTINDHACLTFGEPEELLDLTAAFVRDGLAEGRRVIWLAEEPERRLAELRRRGVIAPSATVNGQMEVLACQDGLLEGQAFELEHAMGWLRDQMAYTTGEGFAGLRVALDMSWALRPVAGIEQLPAFEEEIAAALEGASAAVLCQYDRERFDPVTLASVSGFHTRSVAAATYHHDALLRICRQYAPPGVRLAGQLDRAAEGALGQALSEAIRVDGDITVNMAELSFIDLYCARMIIDAARSLPRSRVVVLRCSPAISARFVLLGATALPGIRLVTVNDG
ncbi:MEDS domain-containing protein [Spongiactinospora sp. TRM90649]|uniref:MEDS domain-containing protein n=1 Tax=Spongiactinospora sp. TRM90649 TaxID=3031114 RepID=UPI0023F7AAC3|nr:MEDS domain-containing protein [Spongiactinospora sp. TRM90649]MDF5752846.1 MEDS domain-containing protein [Spongiactinospora sp. TRM90649]